MVCGERTLETEKNSSAYIQGKQTHEVTAYYVDQGTGEKQDVSVELLDVITKLQILTGVVLVLVFFGLFILFLNWAARRLGKSFAKLSQPSVRRT